MQDRSKDFSMQDAMRLAGTDAGKQLLQMLQNNHSNAMEAAGKSARAGDMEKTKQALSAFLSDPKAQILLKKLQEETNGRNGR